MRRILVDLDVVLDVLLERTPHAAAAAALWRAVERHEVEALLPAHGFTTVFYLAGRHRDASFAHRVVSELATVFGVAPVDASVIRRALDLGWPDFEDAVCAAAAEAATCDAIVSRDRQDFIGSPLEVIEPAEAVAWVAAARLTDDALAGKKRTSRTRRAPTAGRKLAVHTRRRRKS